MIEQLIVNGAMPLAAVEDVEEVHEHNDGVDALGILRELAAAWKRLVVVADD